jgi:hypothetical protein
MKYFEEKQRSIYGPCNCKNSNCVKTPSWSTVPLSWLLLRSNWVNNVSWYSSVGSVPAVLKRIEKEKLRFRNRIFNKYSYNYHHPMIHLHKALKSKSMKTKFVNLPTSVGMVPSSPPRSIPQIAKLESRPISVVCELQIQFVRNLWLHAIQNTAYLKSINLKCTYR